jgi:hypothetical protein
VNSPSESIDRSSLQVRSLWQSLDAFFFEPTGPETLALIRIFTGLMIAYIHFIWMLDLEAFMGSRALLDNTSWSTLHSGPIHDSKWTYLAYTNSMIVIWSHEILGCAAGLSMAIGFATRCSCFLGWLLTLLTAHRLTGFLFGLDQVTLMLAMYVCLSRCGSFLSVDAWLALRINGSRNPTGWFVWITGVLPTCMDGQPIWCWSNRFATRLMQLHLCVIYLFGGIGKMRGETWWDGSAMWYSVAAYEYQSLDMTWIGYFPFFASIATHITVFWEMGYCALIWPRWTRPVTLGIACLVHGGIALFLGMPTFGWMMIVANLAFVSPEFVRHCSARIKQRFQ